MCSCPAHRDLVDCECQCDHTDDRLSQWKTRALEAEAERDTWKARALEAERGNGLLVLQIDAHDGALATVEAEHGVTRARLAEQRRRADRAEAKLKEAEAEVLHWHGDLTRMIQQLTAERGALKAEVERLRGELGQATADLEAANHFLAQQGPLLHRAEQAEAERDALTAAIERVRRLCELTIATSCRADAIAQAEDTLAALDAPETPLDAERIADEKPTGVHAFKQNPAATQVSVCICGLWRDHHVHGGDPCGCDARHTHRDADASDSPDGGE